MAIEWMINGREFVNCNCSYGCPCQFNAPPTHGSCEASCGFLIETGHFGDVKLDGLASVALYQWPGPVHKGNGKMQLIIDERADARQRDALVKIMTGAETKDMATMWWVFSAMCPTKFEPLFKPVKLDIDVASRRGQLSVPGLIEGRGEPIRNPVTGAEHRARIDLPHGFEYRLAEIGSGRTKVTSTIALDLHDTYAQFAELHLSGDGIVDQVAA